MIKKILYAILAFVVLICIYAAVSPSEYYVERQQTITAAPEKIFPLVNNAKKMNDWMPWSEADPKMVMTYSGPDEGVDAVSSWTSEGQMGVGSAKIVESVANEKVVTLLEYKKPFEGTQTAEVSISPSTEGQSLVKWSVKGHNNFIGRIMCIFMNMDKMVGSQFEKGLLKLKELSEAAQ